MIISGAVTARFYENKDTYYGTVYYTDGRGDVGQILVGGWGDWYYGYTEWDLNLAPPAEHTISCEMFLHCSHVAANDPTIKVRRVTNSWSEADISKSNHPMDTDDGQVSVSQPVLEEYNVIDITDMYNGWENGTYNNYGIKLHPTANSNTVTYFCSGDNLGMDKDPYLEVVYQVQ